MRALPLVIFVLFSIIPFFFGIYNIVKEGEPLMGVIMIIFGCLVAAGLVVWKLIKGKS